MLGNPTRMDHRSMYIVNHISILMKKSTNTSMGTSIINTSTCMNTQLVTSMSMSMSMTIMRMMTTTMITITIHQTL